MNAHDLSASLDAAAKLREPTRLQLYRYVVKQGSGVSRDQAAQAIGISRGLAAFHLDKLVAVGLLKSDYRRLSNRTGPGAGRTSKLYRRARRQFRISLPERQHELLASFFTGSASSGDQVTDPPDVAREYGRALGARARHRLRAVPTPERLSRCLESVLESLGFEPYRDSGVLSRLRNCPFDPLSRRFEGVVCSAGVALVEGLVDGVGAPGIRVDRQPDRERCCVVLAPQESSTPSWG